MEALVIVSVCGLVAAIAYRWRDRPLMARKPRYVSPA